MSLKSILTADYLPLKARIVTGFHANPFLETDAAGLAVRFGEPPAVISEAVRDLADVGILVSREKRFVFAPDRRTYDVVAEAAGALGAGDAAARQEVRELESLSRMQEALAVEREEVSAVLDMMPAGVVMIDRFGTVLKANALARAWLGAEGTARDANVCGLLGIELEDALRNTVIHVVDLALPLEVTAKPFALAGSDAGAVITLVDIRERRRLEAEAVRARETFFSMIRHELRRPLLTVGRYLDDIPGEGEDLGHARDASERLSRMVDDMLLLARMERDPLAARGSERIPVGVLVAGCVLAAREPAQAKGIALRADEVDEALAMTGDSTRLHQVVGNLIDNAIKFTPEGGTVTVSAGRDADAVWIRVDDDGPGIPVEERDAVTERFYQVRQDEARTEGLGLGLAICARIIAAHDGRLEVGENASGGTRVTVALPISTRRAP